MGTERPEQNVGGANRCEGEQTVKVDRDPPAPLHVAQVHLQEARTQVAALCWRLHGRKTEVLLVTSRETGRWVVPKGWPMRDASATEAAATEAWEEAGATGLISDVCQGFFAYHKVLGPDREVPCIVAVYPMKVTGLADSYPEKKQRKRRWFPLAKAADKVAEPELKTLIRGFVPVDTQALP